MSSKINFEDDSKQSIYHRVRTAKELNGRSICCCGTKTWCLIIAIVTTIYCSFDLTYSVITFKNGTETTQMPGKAFMEAYTSTNLNESMSKKAEEMALPPIFTICSSSLNIVASLILILGVCIRKPGFLVFWLSVSALNIAIYTVICTIVIVTVVISRPSTILIVLLFLVGAFYLGLPMFCYWVVWLHRRHLLREAKKDRYVKEFERMKKVGEKLNYVEIPVGIPKDRNAKANVHR